jgi:hypothetical protein
MSTVLAIFAALMILASGCAVLFPSEILSFVRELVVDSGVWWAAFGRLVLAVLLWFSASASRTPITFKVLAVLAVMGATFILAIGSEGMLEFIDVGISWPLWAIRLESMLGVAFGSFILWSIYSKPTVQQS